MIVRIIPLTKVDCTASSDSEYLNRLSNSDSFKQEKIKAMDTIQRHRIIFYNGGVVSISLINFL